MMVLMYRTLAEALAGKQRNDGNPPDRVEAVAIGVPETTYNRWKSGVMVPGDERANDIARFLLMDIDEVYALLARSRIERKAKAAEPGDRPVSRAEFDMLQERFDQLVALLKGDTPEPPPASGTRKSPRQPRR